MPQRTAAQLHSYVTMLEPYMRDHPNRIEAVNVACRLAETLGDTALTGAVHNLPTAQLAHTIGVAGPVASSPYERTPDFDAAIDEVIRMAYAVVDARAAHDEQV